MNFTDFEGLRKKSTHLSKCLDDCIEAERNARIRPMHTLIVTRHALENLFLEQCRMYKIKPDYDKNDKFNLAKGISDVCRCLRHQYKEVKADATFIREKGNEDAHAELSKNKMIHAATEKNIAEAMEVLETMYRLLGRLYSRPRGTEFKQKRVPFDDYKIIRQIDDPTNPNLTRYFVRGTNGRDYYLQCLSHQEMAELEARRQAANKRVYEKGRRRDNRLLLPVNMALPYESDRKILLYDAYPESQLLSELKENMKLKDALRLGLDLIEALEQLKELGMHHRSIYPGCIMLDHSERSGYEAFLMDLHTSKIIDSNLTINSKLANAYDSSQYVPEVLKGMPLADTDWEKVDVYAVCRVVLFCLDRSLVQINNTSRFREHEDLEWAEVLPDLYRRIFQPDPDLRNIPTLKELKELFQDELGYCM